MASCSLIEMEVPTKCKESRTTPAFESSMVFMRSGPNRLASFRRKKCEWPHSFLSPEILADAGFFYLMKSDKVMCAFCRSVLSQWRPWHEPLAEHFRHTPNCPLLMEEPVGNIPIMADPIIVMSPDAAAAAQVRPDVVLKYYGIQPRYQAKYPQYASLTARKESFMDLSGEILESVADAGYYFDDDDQTTKCFYCGDLLMGDPTENRMNWKQRHAILSPNCGNVRRERGKAFIEALEDDCTAQMAKLVLENPQSIVLCTSCLKARIGVAFLPCGDAIVCQECANAFTMCPICNVDVNGFVTITLPV
jgi:Inhibitor of Apoptosis domain/Zinc finger, C3HC4 type (RING finger)